MATTITVGRTPLPRPPPFPVRRPQDYNFILTYVALIWLAVLAGFVPDVVRHLQTHAAAYPIAVHLHAAITVAWLALLTSQTLLIRKRKVPLHRKWGTAGAILAVAVVVAGLWAALTFEGRALGTAAARPNFLAIEWSNIIEFAGLVTAAVALRNLPSTHKRLILLATLSLTPAAFNRAIGKPLLHPLLGNGVWETYVQIFAATDILVLGIGLYDWLTRRRVHPGWVLGALWILACQLSASWLFYSPAWKSTATSILRTW